MKNYNILKAVLSTHRNPIIELKCNNLKVTSEEEYAWKYEKSPFGKAECWIAQEGEKGSYVGAIALFPRSLSWGGTQILGSVSGDFSVNNEHRIGGPAIKLQRHMISSINSGGRIRVIYGIPNENAIAIHKRIGFSPLGLYRRYRKILSINFREGRRLVKTDAVRWVIDAAIKYLSRETYYPMPAAFEVEWVTCFDERFDVLWRKASHQFVVAGERTSSYLNWRFFGHPKKKCSVFALVRNRRDVMGYIAYHLKDNVCNIVDILYIDDSNLLDVLMTSFLRSMRDQRVGSVDISCMGSDLLVRCLKKTKFFVRPASDLDVMIYVGKNVPGREILLSERNWYFLTGDTDSDFLGESNIEPRMGARFASTSPI